MITISTAAALATEGTTTIAISGNVCAAIVAILGGVITIFGYIFSIYRWYLRQNQQDAEIKVLKTESQLLTYGILGCLDGLKQLNCNGRVTETRDKIQKHINEQAHK